MMLYSVRCLEKRIIMAGIGFELKKMFSKKGVFPLLKAYGYAGIVCVGPMLLGMVLLIMISLMSMYFGASHHERELLNSMVTYTLLASMVLTNTFTMVVTRFVADSLYSKKSYTSGVLGKHKHNARIGRDIVWDIHVICRHSGNICCIMPYIVRRACACVERDELSDGG